MNVEIGTETPKFLFWEYFFPNFGILSLQCGWTILESWMQGSWAFSTTPSRLEIISVQIRRPCYTDLADTLLFLLTPDWPASCDEQGQGSEAETEAAGTGPQAAQ